MTTPLQPTTHNGRTFDWVPHHDERSRGYGVEAHLVSVKPRRQTWKPGPTLDQGQEGACTGFGATGCAAAAPVPTRGATSAIAQAWYELNRKADEWPGEDYDGSSVLAAMKVGHQLGMWNGYRWAFGVADVVQAVIQLGPVVIGIPWRAGMYDAPGGVLTVSGDVVGGHCLLVIGYDPAAPELGGAAGFQLLNSWGTSWGVKGTAWIRASDLQALLADQGEAAIPMTRSVGRWPAVASRRAAAVTAAPADRTLRRLATDLRDGDRIVEGVPAELGQETVTVLHRRVVTDWRGNRVRVTTTAGTFTLGASALLTVRRAVA